MIVTSVYIGALVTFAAISAFLALMGNDGRHR
jgi:hypothetical protein